MRKRRQNTAFRQGIEPTAELQGHGALQVIEAPRIPGHDGGNIRTVRREPIVGRWLRDGWVSRDQAAALLQWLALHEAARLDGGRSCLDISPRGGHGCRSERTAMARRRLGEAKFQIYSECGGCIGMTVWGWMVADSWPNYAEDFQCSIEQARRHAKLWVARVGASAERVLR